MDLSMEDLSVLGIYQELVAHAVFFTPGQIHSRESLGRFGHSRTGHSLLVHSTRLVLDSLPVFLHTVLSRLSCRLLSLDISLSWPVLLAAGLTVLANLSRLPLPVFLFPSGFFPAVGLFLAGFSFLFLFLLAVLPVFFLFSRLPVI